MKKRESAAIFKLIIADFDRTLVDADIDWPLMRKKLSDFCFSFGVNFDQSKSTFKGAENAVKILLKKNHNRKLAHKLHQNLLKIMEQEEIAAVKRAKPIKGAKNFLKWLKQSGIKFIVFSNNHRHCIIDILKKLKFPLPEMIIGCDDFKYQYIKPDHRGLKKGLKKIKIRPAQCLLIGDSDADFKIGKALKIKTFILNLYYKQKNIDHNFNKDGAVIPESFNQLKQILVKNFNQNKSN